MGELERRKTAMPLVLGYEHLERELGRDRRTIQRMVERGTFPKPFRVSPGTVGFHLDDVLAWLDARRSGLVAAAVSDPAKLAPADVESVIAALGARLASAQSGRTVTPDEIEGVTVRLSPDERAALAAKAAERQRQMVVEIVDRLDKLHVIEALILQRAFLKPLAPSAEACLQQVGVAITMTDAEWREAALLIVERLLNGDSFDASTPPSEVAEKMADDGILAR